MSEKKNIDRLFREKLKDFDMAPPERLWQNIEAELKKEDKERKVIPLWFKLSGVAAVLLIGLLLSMPLFTGIDAGTNPVVIDNTGNNSPDSYNNISPDTNGSNAVNKTNSSQTAVADGSATEAGNQKGRVINKDKFVKGNTPEKSNEAVAYDPNNQGTDKNNRNKTSVNKKASINTVATKDAVATQSKKQGRRNNLHNGTTVRRNDSAENEGNTITGVSGREAVATNAGNTDRTNTGTHTEGRNAGAATNKQNSAAGTNNAVADNNKGRNTTKIDNNENPLAGSNGKTVKSSSGTGSESNTAVADNTAVKKATSGGSITGTAADKAVAGNEKTSTTGSTTDATGTNPENSTNGISPNTIIKEDAVAEVVVDTTTAAPENELEKLLREKELGKDKQQEAVAEANKDKWNIRPQLAPVFYNSLSSGSPIDSQFAGNSKSYDNDLSYGIGVNYAVNNRISIRSGVNTVNLNYATNDIQFYAALTEQMPNIAARGTKANIVVANANSVSSTETQKFNGSLIQKMGYIEVPLEMSYKLVNSRFGIDIIGGVSTLFLNENNVSVLSSQGYSSDVGEAENLNTVHFSTNVGVGFKYRFWKAFEANFEPMFKYQVNTFSNDAGNFKPYFIGLYSGVSFSF